MLSVNFNGHELNKYIGVLSGFTLLKGAEFLLDLQDIDGGNGSRVFNTHYGPKTIPMPFRARNDLINKYDELQRILKVDEPKPLIFGNAPDRIYYAMPVGDMDMDEFLNFGKGTITWLVPDGLAHATTEIPFPATLNSDGILEATIVNDGTASVPISYEIKHKSDNGYIGIVSDQGVMEFGDKAEIDKVNNKMSEKVINFDYDQEPSGILLNEGVSCYPNYLDDPTMSNTKEGSFTFGKNQYGTTIALPNFGSSTAQYWHGPMMSFDIPPATSTGLRNGAFLFRSRFEFSTDVPKSGRTEFTLSNGGSRMFSFVFRDSESYSDSMVLEFHVKNTKLLEQSLDRRKFINGVYQIEIKKLGTTVNFKLARADQGKGDEFISSRVFEKSFNLSYLENIEVTQLSIWTVKYRNVPETSMGIVGTSFYWADLDNWVDLANRYSAGDVFYVDGISKRPYLNGVGALNDEIIGTQYFLAPPGETKVKFYFSDFGNELPDVKAIIRKGWL